MSRPKFLEARRDPAGLGKTTSDDVGEDAVTSGGEMGGVPVEVGILRGASGVLETERFLGGRETSWKRKDVRHDTTSRTR